MQSKRGQIWVETVIYILIALIMIGAVLAFINPKIKEIQDKLTLDKTVELLEGLDSKITEVSAGVGNKRIVNIEIKRGELVIGTGQSQNEIIYTLEESNVAYSEPVAEDVFTPYGKVSVNTVKKGDVYKVKLKIESSNTLNYVGTQLIKSSSAYKLSITNLGGTIDIELIS